MALTKPMCCKRAGYWRSLGAGVYCSCQETFHPFDHPLQCTAINCLVTYRKTKALLGTYEDGKGGVKNGTTNQASATVVPVAQQVPPFRGLRRSVPELQPKQHQQQVRRHSSAEPTKDEMTATAWSPLMTSANVTAAQTLHKIRRKSSQSRYEDAEVDVGMGQWIQAEEEGNDKNHYGTTSNVEVRTTDPVWDISKGRQNPEADVENPAMENEGEIDILKILELQARANARAAPACVPEADPPERQRIR